MNQKQRCLLIVEDDAGLQRQLRWSFEDYDVLMAGDRPTALALLRRHEPAVVLQDLGLPPDATGTAEGFATIAEILQEAPHTKIVVVTGNGDRDNAVKSIGCGAYDFCSKPLELEVLRLIVDRAFRVHELEAENRKLRSQSTTTLEGIIGSSGAMLDAFRLIEKVSPSNATVLLLGETGTGKEVFARAVHRLSTRSDGPFVAINCAAIPETLLEAELFGHEKGAYTGAHKQTKGKIELAVNGTLLLDEIGDMPFALQAKLLRFLEERVVERIGGREPIPVDVRIICATHQDLPALISAGRFREDLFYRVSEVTIRLPPLRERAGDIAPLARHFLEQAASRHGRAVHGFTAKALKAIEACPWRGNVRELENVVNSAVIMADGKQIELKELHLGAAGSDIPDLRKVRNDAEKHAIQLALTRAGGNLSHVAGLLGISRPTLYDLLDKHGLKKPTEID
ncbi:sigma-54-dependent Fis family transcriptional regulator [Rhodanobacter thiooxydans]|uniref:Sigma-54-dependent Fis family transcriptional regulator n=1 Tax=Rhodanobacter thiooxydans TaxID=416169 RepID=A0A154QIB5_9GAMM|nr:PEP-CTERM-box response regulator transcription factor [Rhodanobacter thiooxydans]EIM02198.1 response regulator receiver protein [Rhodanobacter thiooxydans LCS2]KZC23740.1 sigma-54-dependent Fis family transcriptional regulator [Rhodanobacter thiooxydans]MCW0200510.1 PEP-CTERM-box response regulator transcription factor [Rhodanobacter thiooxydans]